MYTIENEISDFERILENIKNRNNIQTIRINKDDCEIILTSLKIAKNNYNYITFWSNYFEKFLNDYGFPMNKISIILEKMKNGEIL